LEIIHLDICGPMQELSLDKIKYFINCVDDFSGRTWVSLIKDRYVVFNIFQQIENVIEKQSDYALIALLTIEGKNLLK